MAPYVADHLTTYSYPSFLIDTPDRMKKQYSFVDSDSKCGQFDTSPTQGWGKVLSKVGARSGHKQGPGRQGWGKVGARLRQGLDKSKLGAS